MATQVRIKEYRLTKKMREILRQYLTREIGAVTASSRAGISRTKLDIMAVTLIRRAATDGVINIEEIVNKY